VTDRQLLAKATEFEVGHFDRDALTVCRCEGKRLPVQPYMWAVRISGNVLGKDGELEYEPTPSSRDDAFYAEYRFATLDDSWAAAERFIHAAAGRFIQGGAQKSLDSMREAVK